MRAFRNLLLELNEVDENSNFNPFSFAKKLMASLKAKTITGEEYDGLANQMDFVCQKYGISTTLGADSNCLVKVSDISSIGELRAANGGRNLVVILVNNHHRNCGVPNYFVNITNDQWLEVADDNERMKELAVKELNDRLLPNSDVSGFACRIYI